MATTGDPPRDRLSGAVILVGVSGSIAAYKAADLVSELVQRGAEVHVLMTRAATEFIRPLTLSALAGRPVVTEMFDSAAEWEVEHIALAQRVDLVVLAPVTAHLLARLAHGMADDMLMTTVLACRCPILIAPAMNTRMWTHVATQANLAAVDAFGYDVIAPASGWLACREQGPGRMADVAVILAHLEERLARRDDLAGLRVLVTSGPTREPLDRVRFITNASSGKMGHALASAATRRGAEVTLVTGPTMLPEPAGMEVIRVTTAAEMYTAVLDHLERAEVIIGAAAVCDFAPEHAAPGKLSTEEVAGQSVMLRATADILAAVGERKGNRLIVGFSADWDAPLERAREKLHAKRLDLLVCTDIMASDSGFGADTNRVTLLTPEGEAEALPALPKRRVADIVLDRVRQLHMQHRASATTGPSP